MLQRQVLVLWNADEVRNQWLHLRHRSHKARLLSIWRQQVNFSINPTSRAKCSSKGSGVDLGMAESTGLEPGSLFDEAIL